MTSRTIHWTEDTKTMKIRTDIPGFFIEFSNQMVYRIKNTTNTTLNPGTVVFFSGSSIFPTVAVADYTQYATSEGTLGIVAHSIPNDTEGYVVTNGLVRNVNVSTYAPGVELYLASSGSFTNTAPVAPLPAVYLGTVIQSGVTGSISVNIELGAELEEIHNVKINNAQNGHVLAWDAAEQVWKNTTIVASSIDGGTY